MSDGPTGGSRGGDALWLVGLGVALLALWRWHVLPGVPGAVPFEATDLFLYFLPSYTYVQERLSALEIALWNPYQAAGQPFLATMQPGVLYPARLLLLAVEVPSAMHVSILGHVLLIAGVMWALCRELGATRVGAATGAVAFTGAFSLPNLFWPSYVEAGAWLPVAALALARLSRDPRWRWVALLGLAGAMPILAGGYQIALYVVYGLAGFGVALLADPARRRGLLTPGGLGRIAVAGVLAVGTAAPQLLPTLAWTGEAIRQVAPLTDVQIAPIPRPGLAIRETFVPNEGFSPFYLSAPVAFLAVVGAVTGGGPGRVLAVAAVLAWLVSLGRGTPFYTLYRLLPGLAFFRLPRRLFTLAAFFAALAAALGASVGRAAGGPWRRGVEVAALAAVAGALLVVPLRNRGELPWTVREASVLTGPAGLADAVRTVAAGGRALLPADRLDFGVAVKQGIMTRVPNVQDYEPLSSRRLGMHLTAAAGLPPPEPTAVVPFAGWVVFKRPIAAPALLDVLAVRALVLPRDVRPPAGAVRRFATGRDVLWENPRAVPRAYTVERVRFVGDERAALAAVRASRFAPAEEAVVVGVPADSRARAVDGGPRTPLRQARIVADRPERVAIEVAVERPALLVLADAFAPGWTATVDGAPRRVWLTNHHVRGVLVGPGERRVEFAYSPPGFCAGLGLAAVAWGVFTTVALADRRRRPRASEAA